MSVMKQVEEFVNATHAIRSLDQVKNERIGTFIFLTEGILLVYPFPIFYKYIYITYTTALLNFVKMLNVTRCSSGCVEL